MVGIVAIVGGERGVYAGLSLFPLAPHYYCKYTSHTVTDECAAASSQEICIVDQKEQARRRWRVDGAIQLDCETVGEGNLTNDVDDLIRSHSAVFLLRDEFMAHVFSPLPTDVHI